MLGEITLVPVGSERASMAQYVGDAVDAIRRTGIKAVVNEMSTLVEGSMDEILSAFKAAHEACMKAGAPRVLALLRLDDRRDLQAHLAEPGFGPRTPAPH